MQLLVFNPSQLSPNLKITVPSKELTCVNLCTWGKKTLLTLISNRLVVIYYPFHEKKTSNFGIAYIHINADPARRARALGSQSRAG